MLGELIKATYDLSKLGTVYLPGRQDVYPPDVILDVKLSYFQYNIKTENCVRLPLSRLTNLQHHKNVAQNFFEVGLIPEK